MSNFNYIENINRLYQEKSVSATQAIREYTKNARFVTFGCYAATPIALTRAFAEAAKQGYYQHRINAYLFRSSDEVISFFDDPQVLTVIHLLFPFLGGKVAQLIHKTHDDCTIEHPDYTPGHFSQLYDGLTNQYGDPDVHMLQVSPMDEHGYFSFGVDGSFSIPAARKAKTIIVEVNPNLPRTFGEGIIHIEEITAIVEYPSDLLTLPAKSVTEKDRKIASYIADHVDDRACIQLGIGGVPNAVGEYLKHKNDLSIHTELLSMSQIALIKNGNVTNKYKNINRHHTVFNVAMLPSANDYQLLDNNPSMLCYPADYVNNPAIISKIDQMISVNSFIEIDLLGQVASESIHWQQITGTGGQVDFIRGASASKGGYSFLAAHSTAKQGKLSKIVPRLSNIVTTARTDIQYIVTEYGCANLSGMSNRQRAKTLINLSHPNFRTELYEAAAKMNLV